MWLWRLIGYSFPSLQWNKKFKNIGGGGGGGGGASKESLNLEFNILFWTSTGNQKMTLL